MSGGTKSRIGARKSKLKLHYWHRLDAELGRAMEKVMLLSELVCEKRAADHRAKVDAMPKPCHLPIKPLPMPRLPRVERFNDWGLEIA